MIKGRDYLTKVTLPPVIDIEGDKIGYEVQNSRGQIWKYSSSKTWNDKNKDFPEWINFNNFNFFEVIIDQALITGETERTAEFMINLYDNVNSIYNPTTYMLGINLVYVSNSFDYESIGEGDSKI